MKNKKLFICMLTVLASLACTGFVSCKEKPSAPAVVVDIQQEIKVLNVLEETVLNVSTENATGDVIWSSSDESVATVKDGVVTALNAGTATITATVNGISDTCIVEVLRSTEAPVLSVSKTQVSVEKDGEYTVTASVQWLGEDVTDKVKLNWKLGAGAQEGVAMVTPKENGQAIIKGLALGTTDFYVSTTIGDAYVNQKISITVCDSSVWFESSELEVGANGNFLLPMLAIDREGNPVSTDIPVIRAYDDEGEILDVNYAWSSADESIVKIENGKLVAQRAGTADLRGEYQGYQVVITVSIERAVINLDDVITFELADLQPAKLNIQDSEIGEVYLNDALIGTLSDGEIQLDASTYPTMSKELGEREIIAKTDKATYIMTANLYSMLIETPEELNSWHAHAFANGDDGYYVLANSINFNGVYDGSRNWDKSGYGWANPDMVGFKGIFDGNGYIIDGLRIEAGFRGFVTLLQGEGIIRNVAFTNVEYSAIGGFVCQWGCGTIENVYVQYATNARMGYWDKNSTFGGTFMATDNTRNMTGKMTIKNCFVDASKTALEHDHQSYIGGYMKYDKTAAEWLYDGAYAKLNNVYVIGPAQTEKGGEAKLHYNDLMAGSANYGLYHSVSEMAADRAVQTSIAQWDASFWGVKNGTPLPLKIIELGDPLSVNISNSIYYTFEGDLTTYAGKDYTFKVTPTKSGFDEFIVLVNGTEVKPENGVYTITNAQQDLDIDVIHGYIDSGAASTTIEYDETTNTWKLNNAVLASAPDAGREHGNAYLSKEYIAYMMSKGCDKLQFTIAPDKSIAVQVLYRYNGKDFVAYSNADLAAGTAATTITIDLTVASELEFYGTNNRGSGAAINGKGSYLTITNLEIYNAKERGEMVVNKPSSIYYTFEGEDMTYVGDNYTFRVTPTKSGFDEFIVLVNGTEVKPENGVYTISVEAELDIDVVHGYIDSGAASTTIEYDETTNTWKLNNAVLASAPDAGREHGNAYLSKEYIAYMMSKGCDKLQFTIAPDKSIAVQVLYRYNGKDFLAYSNADLAAGTAATTITIDLTVASELEFFGTNNRGSGAAINGKGSYLTITDLKIYNSEDLAQMLKVTKPANNSYYSFSGETEVKIGDNYTFTVTPTKTGLDNFVVLVNGAEVKPESGIYTVKNVQTELTIKVLHGYVESGAEYTTIEYDEATQVWTLTQAIYSSNGSDRTHGNAYISKEYIEYMISQGYTKVQFTLTPSGMADETWYKYNGEDILAPSDGNAAEITVDLTVASELEFYAGDSWGLDETLEYQLTITGLTFTKA